MRPSGWEQVRRVLAIRLDNVGDVVMLGPALRTVRRALPDCHLTLLASPAGRKVAPLLPWLDDAWSERTVWQDASGTMPHDIVREMNLVATVRRGLFDAALIFTSFSQSPYPPAYVCYLAGVPVRIGQSKEFGGSLLTTWVRPGPDYVHQVDRNLALLEATGFEPAGQHLELDIDRQSEAEGISLLAECGIREGDPFTVVAPTASCEARTYPLERFAPVIAALPGTLRMPVVVVGGERDRERLASVGNRREGIFSLVARTSLPQLASIVRRATLVVANNSGTMHVADAFRRPLVVLYSGSEYEEQWRPRASEARLLRRDTPCSPCFRFTCPYKMECLDVTPGEVLERCVEVLHAAGVSQGVERR